MKKQAGLMLMIILALTVVLSACGSKSDNGANNANTGGNAGTASPDASEAPASKLKIGMATDVGGVNDKSFNQSAWEALKKVTADTGAETKYLESKGDADMEPNLKAFVSEKYDLTWGIGFLFTDAMTKVATENPDSKFALIDAAVELPNVESVAFAENEGSFLVGVVAGLTTKTNKIGFVGGMEIPVIKKFEAGFKAGIEAVNPEAAKALKINYVGDFSKPDLGKQAAATMYDAGVDIIFHASGASGNGVFNEAKSRKDAGKDVWVIGVDKDQSLEFGDEITLTSMMKGVEAAVYKVSTDLINGNWKGGQVVTLGLKDNGVGLPETSTKNVPADVLAKVEEFKQKIISGEITVPTE
ncbi:BMP family ABC transporter substrate-binding protein [Paenibacillus glycanilyticus]|uniref:BMP family lipoprotein n=1 Tax=Paenibacillus glycanilyticus TaxID=126569 RepID=UPI00203CDB7D|nr:BMP family ABC transporter substrate-binding protein [Paenibacillus glycanilyticus]MCM3631339.1 BMP family ABC transporter substrate-binding protein [Paenibacillus glycanilyticus]